MKGIIGIDRFWLYESWWRAPSRGQNNSRCHPYAAFSLYSHFPIELSEKMSHFYESNESPHLLIRIERLVFWLVPISGLLESPNLFNILAPCFGSGHFDWFFILDGTVQIGRFSLDSWSLTRGVNDFRHFFLSKIEKNKIQVQITSFYNETIVEIVQH